MRFEYVYFLVIAKWIFTCSHPFKIHDLNHLPQQLVQDSKNYANMILVLFSIRLVYVKQ